MELTFAARHPENRIYRIVPIYSLTTYTHLQPMSQLDDLKNWENERPSRV